MITDPETGRNYDLARFVMYTNEPGFILGVSKLGDKLGPDGTETVLDANFTSVNRNVPGVVDSGLWVYREVETLTLTAVMPSAVDLRGKRIKVTYDGVEFFKGTVQEVNWTKTVDFRPESLGQKRYSVNLVVSSGEEAWANAKAPVRIFTSHPIEQRFEELLGIDCDGTNKDPAPDINPRAYTNVYDNVMDANYGVTTGEENLVDVLRNYTKLVNMHYVYKPWDGVVELRNNAQWHSGSDEADSLCFTDNQANISEDPSGDDYVHGGRFVSYTSQSWGDETSMFAGSARVQTQFYTDPDPVLYGPYRASEINPADTVVDLGKQFFDVGDALARNYVATLPLKRGPQQFTKALTVPLQSYRQIESVQVPGMALLEADGVTERVAVLGMNHSITPYGWFITYELGPRHLLDRYSDYDPSPPTDLSVSLTGSASALVEWHTPESMPTDTALYWYVFRDNSVNGNTISWGTDITVIGNGSAIGEQPGDLQQIVHGPLSSGVYTYHVAYTSDPVPGSGVATQIYRQGQPALAGTLVIP